MRPKVNPQTEFNFHPSNLKITNDYYAKYEAISKLLDETPGVLQAVHNDLEPALKQMARKKRRGADFEFTSDTILRIVLCQIIEECSLRQIIVRIDDSNDLRSFVRIYNGPMIDYSTFCKPGRSSSRSGAAAHPSQRKGPQRGEDLQPLRAAHGVAQTRQGEQAD